MPVEFGWNDTTDTWVPLTGTSAGSVDPYGDHLVTWDGTLWHYRGATVSTRPSTPTFSNGGRVVWDTSLDPDFDTQPPLMIAGDVWRPHTSVGVTVSKAYVDSIGILRFASTTERDTLLPTPLPGQVVQMADTGAVQRWNGTNWAGDPAAVNATMTNSWAPLGAGYTTVRQNWLGDVQLHVSATHTGATSANVLTVPSKYYPPQAIATVGWITESGAFKAARVTLSTSGVLSFVGHTTLANVTAVGVEAFYRAGFYNT